MSAPVLPGRRAERFAVLLEEAAGRRRRRRRTGLDDELSGLMRVATRVSVLADLTGPSEQFRSDQRAVLLAMIERDGIGTGADQIEARSAAQAATDDRTQVLRPVRARAGRARAALLVGLAAGALAISGVSAASTDSLPGEPLYQVKRSAELAKVALAGSEYSRGQLQLDLADKRLAEALLLPSSAAAMLSDFDESTTAGVGRIAQAAVDNHDPSVLDQVAAFAEKQDAQLRSLAPLLSSADSVRLRESSRLLASVEHRVSDLRAALAKNCAFSDADTLGPVPTC